MLRMMALSERTPGPQPTGAQSEPACRTPVTSGDRTSLEHFHTWRLLGLSLRLRLSLYFVMFTLVLHSLYALFQKPDILSTKCLFRYFHCHRHSMKVLFFILSAKQPLSLQHFSCGWFLDLLLFSCFSLQQSSLSVGNCCKQWEFKCTRTVSITVREQEGRFMWAQLSQSKLLHISVNVTGVFRMPIEKCFHFTSKGFLYQKIWRSHSGKMLFRQVPFHTLFMLTFILLVLFIISP